MDMDKEAKYSRMVLTELDENGKIVEQAEAEIIDLPYPHGGYIAATFEALMTGFIPMRDLCKFRLLFADCKGKERRACRDEAKRHEYEDLKAAEVRRLPEFQPLADATKGMDPDAVEKFNGWYDRTLKAMYDKDGYEPDTKLTGVEAMIKLEKDKIEAMEKEL